MESEVTGMDLNRVTIQDCIDMFEKKNKYAVLSDGQIIGFEEDDQNGNMQTVRREL